MVPKKSNQNERCALNLPAEWAFSPPTTLVSMECLDALCKGVCLSPGVCPVPAHLCGLHTHPANSNWGPAHVCFLSNLSGLATEDTLGKVVFWRGEGKDERHLLIVSFLRTHSFCWSFVNAISYTCSRGFRGTYHSAEDAMLSLWTWAQKQTR